MRIKYLATYNGPSYGTMGGYDDKLEGFKSIAEAKDELDRRFRMGYGYVSTYAKNDDDLFVLWQLDSHLYFPATTQDDFMELYRADRVGDGLFYKHWDPDYRLSFGPRKGVKVEPY